MRMGSKKIFHLEAWVVKVMSLYKVSSTALMERVCIAEHGLCSNSSTAWICLVSTEVPLKFVLCHVPYDHRLPIFSNTSLTTCFGNS